jgi:dephospho-CoA kinase
MKTKERLTEEKLIQIINEEMSKSEITSLIASKLDANLSSKDFEKKVKEITSSVIGELFKILWQRNTFWKDTIKR